MNAFDAARTIEAESLGILRPFLEEYSHGHYMISGKGPLARALQAQCGDILFNDRSDRLRSVELKAERRHTGNLFLEIWSNRNFAQRDKFLEHGAKIGWLFSNRADTLFYHFLDNGVLYILDMWQLQRWAFGHGDNRANIWSYAQRPQSKYGQMNETVGCLVPLSDLKAAGFVKVFHPKQAELWPEAAE